MVAAERQQERAGSQNPAGFALDGRRRLLMVAVVEQAIAVVDHRHRLEQVAAKRILRIVVEDRRRAPDRLRSETRPRPVRHRRVEGNAPDHGIGALGILGIAAAHEGEGAGIGRIACRAGRLACDESVIDRRRRHPWSFSAAPTPGELIRHSLSKCDIFLGGPRVRPGLAMSEGGRAGRRVGCRKASPSRAFRGWPGAPDEMLPAGCMIGPHGI